MRVLLAVLMLGAVVGGGGRRSAVGEEQAAQPALADRAKILGVELRRGPAADLAPFLAQGAHPALRAQAIRALGRIGDRAGAPALLAEGLKAGATDLLAYLEAAGLSAAKSLEGAVLPCTESKDPAVAAAAFAALGWIGGDSAVAALVRGLHRTESAVLAAVLEGLARAKVEGLLERVLRWRDHPDADVQQAVRFASWMLAGARRTAATAGGAAWAGDDDLAFQIHSWAGRNRHADVSVVRPLGILTPFPVVDGTPSALGSPAILPTMAKYLVEGDERVAQEALARIYATRLGGVVDEALASALGRPDPITRQAAIEAAAGKPRSQRLVAALRSRMEAEADARVREALAVALCKLGDEPAAQAVLARKDRPKDVTLRVLTELRVLGASKREGAVQELCDLARSQAFPAAMLEALSLLEERAGEPAAKLVGEALGHPDAYARAAAVSLVGKHKLVALLPDLARLMEECTGHAERDIRQAVVEAWAELADQVPALRESIVNAATLDPAFTARAAARDAMKKLNLPGVPGEVPLQPNDWAGLPRPKGPILGVDLSQGEGPLTEAEILTLADRMQAERPEFVVENDVGSFRLAIDPTEAPVHAVSFLLCVASGVYEKTLWHRVVPSFVIQGGDPHGTGNGDAGWSLPDEITRGRFVRGALGMPKGAIRDTGGCQLFVMHSDYRPLDGRYTCYGRVVDGMETVDRIRVGDRTLKVGMVVK